MPSIYSFKPAFQNLLRPLANRLASWGFTANQITIFAWLLSTLLGLDLAFGSKPWFLLPPFLIFRMALNAIDGLLAREHGQHSQLGAVLNELTDILSDAALMLPFAYLPGWSPFWIGFTILLAALTELTGVLGTSRRYDGPFGKSDRALATGAVAFWLAIGWPIPSWANTAIAPLWATLCGITIFNRARPA